MEVCTYGGDVGGCGADAGSSPGSWVVRRDLFLDKMMILARR